MGADCRTIEDGGQGIASGFRDAMALAWRLKVACHHLPSAYEQMFQAWYLERKQQLDRSLAATIENGTAVTERSALRIFMRDTYLAILQLVPAWKRWLEQGQRRDGMCRYTYRSGLHFTPYLGGGVLCPQVYCRSLSAEKSTIAFTDDIIYSENKLGLFQILAIVQSSRERSEVKEELRSIDISGLSHGLVQTGEETILVHDLTATAEDVTRSAAPGLPYIQEFRIASAAEFAASKLCHNRPPPRYYEPHRISQEFPNMRYVILRPDRFTFTACMNIHELRSGLETIRGTLDDRHTFHNNEDRIRDNGKRYLERL